MATRKNTITLDILVNEKEFVDKLSSALDGSKKAVNAVAKAYDPLIKGTAKLRDNQNAVNRALRSALKLTSQAVIDFDQMAGHSGRVREDLKQIAALAGRAGRVGTAAMANLEARASGAKSRVNNAQHVGNQASAVSEAIAAEAALSDAANGRLGQEEDITTELAKQVRAHIAIAKARQDVSEESVNRLVALERELVGLTNDRTKGLEVQGKLAELLVKTERQLNVEAGRSAGENKKSVQSLIQENRLLGDLQQRQDRIAEESFRQFSIRTNTDDSTDEGRSLRSSAVQAEVALQNEYRAIQREIDAEARKSEAARRKAITDETDLIRQQLVVEKAKAPDDRRERLIELERELDRVMKLQEGNLEKQANYARIVLELRRELSGEERKISDEIGRQVKDTIQNQTFYDDPKARLSNLKKARNDLEASIGNPSVTPPDSPEFRAGREGIIRLNAEIEKTERAIQRAVIDSSKASRENLELTGLRARSGGAAADAAIAQLLDLRKTYTEYLKVAQIEGEDELRLRRELLAIEKQITLARKEPTGEGDTGGKLKSEIEQRQRIIRVASKSIETGVGGEGSSQQRNALDDLKGQIDELSFLTENLTEDTKDYERALDALKSAQKAFDTSKARELRGIVKENTDTIRGINDLLKLQAAPGETGKRARATIITILEDSKRIRQEEEANINAIDAKLRDLGNVELQGLKTQEDAVELERLRNELIDERTLAVQRASAAGQAETRINSEQARGSGRAALRARRRENGFDSYQAVVDIGRVFQDAPYGFSAIANNIGPLIESVSLFYERVSIATNGVGTFGVALRSLAKDLIFTPIGFVAIFNIIVYLGVMMPKIIKFVDEMVTGMKSLRDIVKDVQKQVGEEGGTFLGNIAELDLGTLRAQSDELISSIRDAEQASDDLNEAFNRIRASQMGLGGTFGTTSIGLNLLNKAFGFFGQSVEQIFPYANQQVVTLDGAYKALGDTVAEELALVNALNQGLAAGLGSNIVRDFENNNRDIRKQILETSLASARTNQERVRLTTQIFRLETQIQREELRKQLDQQRLHLRAAITVFETQARLRARQIRPGPNTFGIDQIRRLPAYQALQEQLESTRLLAELYENFDSVREGALEGQLESFREQADTAQNAASNLLQALRAIADVEREVANLRISNANDILDLQFALRRQETERTLVNQREDRRRAIEDFREEVKDLRNRADLIAQFTARQNQLVIQQEVFRNRELRRIEEAESLWRISQAQRVADALLAISQANAEAFKTGDERESAFQQIEGQRQINDLLRRREELSAAADKGTIDEQVIALLDEEIRVRGIAIEQERQRLALAQQTNRVNAEESFSEQSLMQEYQLRELIAGSIGRQSTRERELLDINYEREIASIDFAEAEAVRNALLIEDAQDQADAIERIEVDSNNKRLLAQEKFVSDSYAISKTLLTDSQNAWLNFAGETLQSLSQTADLFQSNSEARIRRDLEARGASEEEITETIEKSARKRKKVGDTLARIEIVRSTAVAAMSAFEGTLTAFKFLGPGALPLAIGAAGLAIAFGKAQLDAVGLETIRGAPGSGGSGSVTVGLESAPGIMYRDPFSNTDPFGRATRGQEIVFSGGMSELGDRITSLAEAVVKSSETIAARPAVIGYDPSSAATLVKTAVTQEKMLTR